MFRNTPGRLSARWKVFHHSNFRKNLNPVNAIVAACLSLLLMTACQDKSTAQTSVPKGADGSHVASGKNQLDTLNKPKVDIKVNRHFDEKGNVIGFDSTYTSYYSSVQGDTIKMDSMFSDFNSYFNKQHRSLFNDHFNNLFFNDSLMYPDFFHKDFFSQRYKLNDRYFRDMMTEMDSVKNRFYRENRDKPKP
jgi:hypothetical protein